MNIGEMEPVRGVDARQASWSASALVAPAAGTIAVLLAYRGDAWGLLGWVAFVPLCLTIATARSAQKAVAIFAATGFVHHAATLDFIRTTGNPSGSLANGRFVWEWLGTSCAGSVQWSLVGLVLYLFNRHCESAPWSIRFPCAWGFVELSCDAVLRHAFAMSNSILHLGMTQGGNPAIMQLADLGGTPGVGWVVATLNGSVTDAILAWNGCRFDHRSRVSLALGCIVFVSATIYGLYRLNEAPHATAGARVAVIPDEFLTSLDATAGLLAQSPHAIDYVIWPEQAYSTFVRRGDHHGQSLRVGRRSTEPDPGARRESTGRESARGVLS
jgi:apolipoprotein N-acyltransferase